MAVFLALGGALGVGQFRSPLAVQPLPTTLEDFFQGGSQPEGYEGFLSSANCGACHGGGDDHDIKLMKPWQGSMMAQAARDPMFYACLAIAEQDAPFSGDLCIRCHVPRAWLMGRSDPPNGSEINQSDRDGVNCHFCHRMVDPIYKPNVSPPEDYFILENLETLPGPPGGANYVADPFDRRRGPRPDVAPPHPLIVAPFHKDAALCATCHDVSNPAFTRQPDDTYVANAFGERHPTDNKYDMFPLERTYSEWLESAFARGGIDMGGRFGGNQPVVSTCQDCHMPSVESKSCNLPDVPVRNDLRSHDFTGANAWAPDMVANVYANELDEDALAAMEEGKRRAISMVQRAITLEVDQSGDTIVVRVINETGHKLPSGYPEGRRIWINVRFYDAFERLIREIGHYDDETAELDHDGAKVYEAELGVDEAVSRLTGVPAGPSFHFAINNVIYRDNRIPPRGFTNAGFKQVQAMPVAAGYSDGQYWDDTPFTIPLDAVRAEVRVMYQTSSREYIEFLRDENVTNDAGRVLYEQWQITGKSPPIEMAAQSLPLEAFQTGDFDGNRVVDLFDYSSFASCADGPRQRVRPECRPADLDGDRDVDLEDVTRFQRRFGQE
ncbi:MAG: hypothetical protein C4547_10590 [Phycisphaerales bacterium]|nr:MAG: hypothetical protein C4547_10590 [Phycisphaerales bacterium]